jgi:signal transduction histidine kinase
MLKRILLLTVALSIVGIILIVFAHKPGDIDPAEIMILNQGWKFHAGDDTSWAQPAFDDQSWTNIDPTEDIHDSFPRLKKSGIAWLRIKIPRDTLQKKGMVAISISQSVASEIYLNGKLLFRYGDLGKEGHGVKTYDPLGVPKPFPYSTDSVQLIAARVALPLTRTWYTIVFGNTNPLLRTFLIALDRSYTIYFDITSRGLAFSYSLVGLFLMLFILHLSFFILYPVQKANFHFAMFALSTCIANLFQLVATIYIHSVESKFYLTNLAFDCYVVAALFLTYSLQIFLKRNVDIYFLFILLFGLVSIIAAAIFYKIGTLIPIVAEMLLFFNIVRLALIFLARKVQGAWIIMIGAVANIIFFMSFIFEVLRLDITNGFFNNPIIITSALNNLSFPISMTLFLALDFAFTNKMLKATIKENAALSDKNMAQQLEKQELLSSINQQLETQVNQRTVELSKSLENLKATQSQLIQSEKMASLGELTAGIAHEIQNPLNFVNNFSEINRELIDEASLVIKSGNPNEIASLLSTLRENEEKISHHGKRADGIVKGMLQHSRETKGQKEPTDLNALADEYLRLSFQGMRSKDKSFNAALQTHFDQSIGEVNIIPQDIGRVLLNVYNNAFYAVNEKMKNPPPLNVSKKYEPTVSITTRFIKPPSGGSGVEIRVSDNGVGIPDSAIGKIFQPFFTTKPSGQGTGLGLSLSYDIVKAHGGEIKVQSTEGEGTEFIVNLPV